MKTPCITSLKIALWLVCIPHLVMGILICLPFTDISQIAAIAYKANVIPTPQLDHVARMLAGYYVVIGVLALLAIRDPLNSSAIIFGFCVLLFIRFFQTITFVNQAYVVFGMPAYVCWVLAVIYITLASALIFLRPRPDSSCCKD